MIDNQTFLLRSIKNLSILPLLLILELFVAMMKNEGFFFLFSLLSVLASFSKKNLAQSFSSTKQQKYCRGGRMADAKGWLKIGGGSRALVGSRGEVGMSERGTQDIPRFGALRRDNTPSPAESS